MDESLALFPYVNGELYAERIGFADFSRDMRNALLACTKFDWSRISPAIFGSLFQSVMEPKERRQIGAHYTSEQNIMKVIRSLFLDDLKAEFEKARKNKPELRRFHEKLARLHFFDPACGCGNFLVVTYRELRLLELDVLVELFGGQTELTLDEVNKLAQVDVDQFYGIEIGEWPARIAEVALWLMDHQMNNLLSEKFGQLYMRLPLKKSPHIHVDNALRMDWKQVIQPENCSYILGNPPFSGGKYMSTEQRKDMELIAGNVKNSGLLDYVCGWYFKAAGYIQSTRIPVCFVSTNSITQGEQVGILWTELFQKFHVKIHFAHRTFNWQSEARKPAHVHVVIIGFGAFDANDKKIYDYENENPTVVKANSISPYLIEGSELAISNRSTPICDVPEIGIGNKPIDGGYYLFTPQEKIEFLKLEPAAKKYFRRWFGSEEFINGLERWCLWLGDCVPEELRKMPKALQLVEMVAKYRRGEAPPKGKEASIKNTDRNEQTKLLANTPRKFHVENMPKTDFLVIPKVSSEKRNYIPIGFMTPDVFCSDLLQLIPNAKLYHFGIITSQMHMAWMRQVCGRLKSDFRYSNKLVYNNFPWPDAPSAKQKEAVEKAAQKVLDTRKQYPACTLADLYDPLTMPAPLLKAHQELDKAVDLCYRPQAFQSDRQRVEYLFMLYEKLTQPLLPAPKPKRRKKL